MRVANPEFPVLCPCRDGAGGLEGDQNCKDIPACTCAMARHTVLLDVLARRSGCRGQRYEYRYYVQEECLADLLMGSSAAQCWPGLLLCTSAAKQLQDSVQPSWLEVWTHGHGTAYRSRTAPPPTAGHKPCNSVLHCTLPARKSYRVRCGWPHAANRPFDLPALLAAAYAITRTSPPQSAWTALANALVVLSSTPTV